MSIASPPVFIPGPATQFANTARAAWNIISEVAIADDLPGLNSNSTVQSPCTVEVRLKGSHTRTSLSGGPYPQSVGREGQRPMSVGLQIVRQISVAVYCV